MRKLRAFVARHRAASAVAGAGAAALLVFVLVWFQPQKLFIDRTVNEAPLVAATPEPSGTPAATVAAGRWRSLEHRTTGSVQLVRRGDGSHVVRFEDLDTSNGPDLRVYLSELPATLGWRDYGKRFIDLGGLKGNRGDQNYEVPARAGVGSFRSVVIWCRRFTVGFAVAPLERA